MTVAKNKLKYKQEGRKEVVKFYLKEKSNIQKQ